jgi:hypothetical protein
VTQLDLFDALKAIPAQPQPTRPTVNDDERLHPSCRDSATCPRCKETRNTLLTTMLQTAVPMLLTDLAVHAEDIRERLIAGWSKSEAAETVASGGDIILFGVGKKKKGKKGEVAKGFNTLAKALAAMAHYPGGVKAFGLLWCATHSPGGAIPTGVTCARCLDEDQARRVVPNWPDLRAAERWQQRNVQTIGTGEML